MIRCKNKPVLIIVDGISGSGKSTLVEKLRHHFIHGIYHMDRSSPSHWVYRHFRGESTKDIWSVERGLQRVFNVVVLWTDCSPEEAARRLQVLSDQHVEDLVRARSLFEQYFERETRFKYWFHLDTERPMGETQDQAVRLIQQFYHPVKKLGGKSWKRKTLKVYEDQ